MALYGFVGWQRQVSVPIAATKTKPPLMVPGVLGYVVGSPLPQQASLLLLGADSRAARGHSTPIPRCCCRKHPLGGVVMTWLH